MSSLGESGAHQVTECDCREAPQQAHFRGDEVRIALHVDVVRTVNSTGNPGGEGVKPQRELLDSAASVERLHMYEGDARRRRKRGLEQKKVDVMLTVDSRNQVIRWSKR